MNIVSIIIARGGSRRLPRKNVLPFCGKSLVEWSIIQSCCSHTLGPKNTYLSTDDDEIVAIGEKHKINIIRRPDWDNPDDVSGTFAISHAMQEIRKKREIDTVIMVLPTSPLRLPDDFDRSIARYKELREFYPDCNAVHWTIPQEEMHIQKYLDSNRLMIWLLNKQWWFGLPCEAGTTLDVDDYIEYAKTENMASDVDFLNSNTWMEPGTVGRPVYYIQGKWFQQFEVDDKDSFELCEIMMERYILKGRGAAVYEEYANGVIS